MFFPYSTGRQTEVCNQEDLRMENKEFAKMLEARTIDIAVKIIKLSTQLPNTPEAKVIKNQMTNTEITQNGDIHGQSTSR